MSQRVQITFGTGEKAYTYNWPGEMPLVVGDRVVVPPNWATPDYSFGTVVQLESKYDGPVTDLTGVVDKDTGHIYYPSGSEPE